MSMKRILLLMVILTLVLTGCSGISESSPRKIVPPDNETLTLVGRWEIHDLIKPKSQSQEPAKGQWTGSTAQFNESGVMIGTSFWTSPGYKIKQVRTSDYFLFKYDWKESDLKLFGDTVTVVTITSGENFLCELVVMDEGKILIDLEDGLYSAGKVSTHVDEAFLQRTRDKQDYDAITPSREEEQMHRTALLLGIRTPHTATFKGVTYEEYSYKTLLISAKNKELRPVYQTEGIFLPRKSGFWRVANEVTQNGGVQEDWIYAYNTASGRGYRQKEPYSKLIKEMPLSARVSKSIVYIGNDYMSLDIRMIDDALESGGPKTTSFLQMSLIDGALTNAGVDIHDVTDANGVMQYERKYNEMVKNLQSSASVQNLLPASNSIRGIIPDNSKTGFGLFRKMGHWFIKGRMNYSVGKNMQVMDFEVNSIPSSEVVAYDILHVPWTVIKDNVPAAVDAFVSPNRDIAIVVCQNRIMIYTITYGQLNETPVAKIPLEEGESIIMAEWSTGEYMEMWQKAFWKHNGIQEMNTSL